MIIFAFEYMFNLKPIIMRVKAIVLIMLAMVSFNAFSQIKFGLRAGVSSSTIKASDVSTPGYQVSTLSNAKVGFHFGLMSQMTIASVYLQPEFLFSSTGGEVEVRNVTTGATRVTDQRYNKLDIPVMVGKKLGPLRLGLGPVASIILNKPSDVVDPNGTSFASKFNGATFGYQLDLGLDIWKLALDLKYEGNLSKLGNGITIGGQERSFDTRNHQFLLSVGWFF